MGDITLEIVEHELITVEFTRVDKVQDVDADRIKGKAVEAPVASDDQKALVFDEATDTYKHVDVGAQYDMSKAVYDTNDNNIVDKAEAIDDGEGNTASAVDIADAVAKKHNHANQAILDAISSAFTTTLKTKLDAIEALAVALSTVKADADIADAISKKHANTLDHTQDTDTILQGQGDKADQSQTSDFDSGGGRGGLGSYTYAQTFIAGETGDLTKVALKVYKYRNDAGTLIVEIRSTSAGVPTEVVLATETIQATEFTYDDWDDYVVSFTSPTAVVSGTKYAIVCRGSRDTNDYYIGDDGNVNAYANGEVYFRDPPDLPWETSENGYDFYFITYVDVANADIINNATLKNNLAVDALKTIDGRDISVDGAKLDNIEANADVTDVTNVTSALGSIIASALSDITSAGADIEDAVTKRNKPGTYTIGATGCDYATIQSALDAQNSGGELFIIYPGTYTDDTIAFTANNQHIQGAGEQCCVLITTANANIVNYGTYIGCNIHNAKITLTAPTSAINMITGSTGNLQLRYCDLEVTVGDVVDSVNQPSAINVTGAGEVTMWFGSIVYNSTNSYANCAKAPIVLGTGATVHLQRVDIDITCSGTAEVSTPVYGSSTGEICMYKCQVDIVDNSADYTVGLTYLSHSGTHEFDGNQVHVTNNTNIAYGIWLNAGGGENILLRTMYNHFHILSSGGSAYSARLVNVRCTWNSLFDDIIASDGYNSSGNITMVSSESDGNITIGGLKVTDELKAELDAGAHSIGFTEQAIGVTANASAIDWKLSNKAKVTVDDNTTISFTNPTKPCNLMLVILRSGAGHTVTLPTIYWVDGSAPTLTEADGAIDIISLYFDGTNYYGMSGLDFQTP